MDWQSELGASEARLRSIDDGLSGDFAGSAEQYAIANALQRQDQPQPRPVYRPVPLLGWRVRLAVAAVVILALWIVSLIH